jgi:hypothetical protein
MRQAGEFSNEGDTSAPICLPLTRGRSRVFRRTGFRLAPEALREQLIDGRLGTGTDRSDLVRLAVQLTIEEALEAEAREKLGANVSSPLFSSSWDA